MTSLGLLVGCGDDGSQTSQTTDAQPTLYLHYAEIVGTALANDVALPITASTAYHYRASRYGLGFHIDASGRQYVSAELGSIFGVAAYFATR